MSVVTGGSEPGPAAASAAGGGGAAGGSRVFFQSPRGGSASREDSVAPAAVVQVQQQQRRHQQGKVTVKYDRKELRKRLVLEEWIVEQLGQLYGCEKIINLSYYWTTLLPKSEVHNLNIPILPFDVKYDKHNDSYSNSLLTLSLWEEEMPDVEIDIDDLLDAANEEERALKLQEALVDCYKPTEEQSLESFFQLQEYNAQKGFISISRSGKDRFFFRGFYQRTSDSDKRDEETEPSSKEEYISEDGAS